MTKPISAARMYAMTYKYTDRTARKHLQMPYYRDRFGRAFEAAAAVATVLRDLLPERALWGTGEADFRHRFYGIEIVVEDVEEFIETTYDTLCARLNECGVVRGVEILHPDETERRQRLYRRDSSGLVEVDVFFSPVELRSYY